MSKKVDSKVIKNQVKTQSDESLKELQELTTRINNLNESRIIKSRIAKKSMFRVSNEPLSIDNASELYKNLKSSIDNNSSKTKDSLTLEISQLNKDIEDKITALSQNEANLEQKTKEISELNEALKKREDSKHVQHLLDSVTSEAHEKIKNSEEFRQNFKDNSEIEAFVVSVDIRRSTELMLKAKSPEKFAEFITTLCTDLEDIFKGNRAIVDKFTGDGILAFFPTYFSGEDAGYLAVKSAKEANDAFENRYKEFRSSFSTVIKSVGLGTGIDFGVVHQVIMAGSLTIVGQPVVYACRMGGAPAGEIYLNQPAYEEIDSKFKNEITTSETEIEIKSEGPILAYKARLIDSNKVLSSAIWNIE